MFMGFLDRFKKQKEQEVVQKTTVVNDEKKTEEKKEKEEIKKEGEKKSREKKVINTEEKDKKVKVTKKNLQEEIANVLIQPLVTEKGANLTSLGQYVFAINPGANRIQVAGAVKAIYGVLPVKVQIQNIRREPVRFGRFRGKQKAWKKAIVCLPKGKTINVHEGI